MSTLAALPGMKGPDHVGITVPDLDQAINFFTQVIGCEPFYQLGPFSDTEGVWMTENLNVHARAEIKTIQLIRCAYGSNLELFEYRSPNQNKSQPKNSGIGGHHLAFYVEDIGEAVVYLEALGIEVLGDVKTMDSGPSAGESWVYFMAPWGMQLELVSYPNGKHYEKSSMNKLFSPNQ